MSTKCRARIELGDETATLRQYYCGKPAATPLVAFGGPLKGNLNPAATNTNTVRLLTLN